MMLARDTDLSQYTTRNTVTVANNVYSRDISSRASANNSTNNYPQAYSSGPYNHSFPNANQHDVMQTNMAINNRQSYEPSFVGSHVESKNNNDNNNDDGSNRANEGPVPLGGAGASTASKSTHFCTTSKSQLENNLNRLFRISLEIESLVNSNSKQAPKDQILSGLACLKKIQSQYDSWLKLSNIENPTWASRKNKNTEVQTSNMAKRFKISPTLTPESAEFKGSTVANAEETNTTAQGVVTDHSPKTASFGLVTDSSPQLVEPTFKNEDLQNINTSSMSIAHAVAPPMSYSQSHSNFCSYSRPYANNYGVNYIQHYHHPIYQTVNENIPPSKYPISRSVDEIRMIKSGNFKSPINFNNITTIDNNCLDQTCRHCSSTATPEWRRGPSGERTLCNACGLFYSKLIKKYGSEMAKNIMTERKKSGTPMDRRVTIS